MAKAKKTPRKRVVAPRRNGLSAAQAGRELEELNRVGIALSETRDVERLLTLILLKAREITGADAGSLYLMEQACGETERFFSDAANGTERPRQSALPADTKRQRAVSLHRTYAADHGIFDGGLLRAAWRSHRAC